MFGLGSDQKSVTQVVEEIIDKQTYILQEDNAETRDLVLKVFEKLFEQGESLHVRARNDVFKFLNAKIKANLKLMAERLKAMESYSMNDEITDNMLQFADR